LSFVFATFAAMWFLGERVPRSLDWRDFDHDRRGVHQLQPARKGKDRATSATNQIERRAALPRRRRAAAVLPD